MRESKFPINGAEGLCEGVMVVVRPGLSFGATTPPYTTTKVPKVASTTASKRLGSHRSLNNLTLMMYAKKALVFQIAYTHKTNLNSMCFFIVNSSESSPVKSVMLVE